ncbi:response regulator [Phenylobacterium terrae]|uniref:Response regulator n=1 Tax=Phenylobacterium terrae TaxID=2665495 RepID=A0ABW4N3F7_9CAUL
MTSRGPAREGLQGLRVLVVEDEGPVAMLIEDMLEDLGCTVVGSAASVEAAMRLVDAGGYDVALLDVNIAGGSVLPVAEALRRRGAPYAIASGYGPAGVPDSLRGAPIIQKPFRSADLEAVLGQALA